ncbi:hypothetical protein PPL_04536 [Heterostelium album PN500]|uniref:Poly [ADP-ribose] polymerase n=1 Tax=Heterostelium pallidum (strain ATCC 26659 / Pp 5 / PN500) TaxID=670386 RepID=D3B7U8_HETP5|nr:hypothetical protein PPL_04536 [Heterostelium album PN500]EFA82841.1 hypothetical protein PPL_04536 [Heterostelium album PN500]|eukprot:XP_020434958.1 hypothetical protein PPL_04536 [Heterostelium album PN500]
MDFILLPKKSENDSTTTTTTTRATDSATSSSSSSRQKRIREKESSFEQLKDDTQRKSIKSTIKTEVVDTLGLEAIAEKHDFPFYWLLPQKEQVRLVEIDRSGTEFYEIHQHFRETLPSFNITKVERVQSKTLWRSYHSKCLELMKRYNASSSVIVESRLYHGTRTHRPSEIYDHPVGFDLSFSNYGSFGKAHYFAMNASYSNGYRHTLSQGNIYQMFYCRVLLGSCAMALSVPFDQMADLTSRGVYDSYKGGDIFTIYENGRAYPEYLITYSDAYTRGMPTSNTSIKSTLSTTSIYRQPPPPPPPPPRTNRQHPPPPPTTAIPLSYPIPTTRNANGTNKFRHFGIDNNSNNSNNNNNDNNEDNEISNIMSLMSNPDFVESQKKILESLKK